MEQLKTKPLRKICTLCGGDGYAEYLGGSGYYSSSLEAWYPLEEHVECPACGGTGEANDAE